MTVLITLAALIQVSSIWYDWREGRWGWVIGISVIWLAMVSVAESWAPYVYSTLLLFAFAAVESVIERSQKDQK